MKKINVTMKLVESYSFKEYMDRYFAPDEFVVVDNLKRHTLGGDKIPEGYDSIEEAIESYIEEKFPNINKEELLIFPVYAHIHGDVSLSLGEYTDPWDSGIAGYVIVHPFVNFPEEAEETKEYVEKAIKEFNEGYSEWIIETEVKYPVEEGSDRYYCCTLQPSIYYYGPEPYDKEEQIKILKDSHFWSKIKKIFKTEDEKELEKFLEWNMKY